MTLEQFLNGLPYKITLAHFAIIEKIFDGDELTNDDLNTIVYEITHLRFEHITLELGPILTPGREGEKISVGYRPEYDSTWLVYVDRHFKLSPFACEIVELWRSFKG